MPIVPDYPYPPNCNLQIQLRGNTLIRYIRGPFTDEDRSVHRSKLNDSGHDMQSPWYQIICVRMSATKERISSVLKSHFLDLIQSGLNHTAIVILDMDEEEEVKTLVDDVYESIGHICTYHRDMKSALGWFKDWNVIMSKPAGERAKLAQQLMTSYEGKLL